MSGPGGFRLFCVSRKAGLSMVLACLEVKSYGGWNMKKRVDIPGYP